MYSFSAVPSLPKITNKKHNHGWYGTGLLSGKKTAIDPSGVNANKGADSSHLTFLSGRKKTRQNEATQHDGCADASVGHRR
jgi:hypothetical protein